MKRCLLLAIFVCGCGAGRPGASYSGSSEPRLTAPQHIDAVDGLPRGYERLGSVSARCKILKEHLVLDEELLANVDCSEERLDRALRERAAEVGGELLVARECRKASGELRCEASVARPTEEALAARGPEAKTELDTAPAPGPREVASLDEPSVSRSWAIKLSFESRIPYERAERAPAELGRSGDPAPQLEPLGEMLARCDRDECEHADLAQALRVGAARVGAYQLSAVRCYDDRHGPACVGSLGGAALR